MLWKILCRQPMFLELFVLALLVLSPSFVHAQVGVFAIRNGDGHSGLFNGRFAGRFAAGGCTSANAGHTYHHIVRERVRVTRNRSYGCQGAQAAAGCTSSQGGANSGYFVPGPSYAAPGPAIVPSKPGTKASVGYGQPVYLTNGCPNGNCPATVSRRSLGW